MEDAFTSSDSKADSLADSNMYVCVDCLCNSAHLQMPVSTIDIEKKSNTNREGFVDLLLAIICDRFDLIFEEMYSVCPSVQLVGKFG